MILYPKLYLNNVTEITISILENYYIQGLILDVDNTLIDYNKNIPDGVEDWIKTMKQNKIKLCILSNTNHKEKVEKVAKQLDIPYLYFAKKPLKSGFKKAKQILQLPSEKIGVIGDQIFTDVIGANRSHMISILVKPIDEKDIFITKIKRPIENKIIKNFQKTNKQTKQ